MIDEVLRKLIDFLQEASPLVWSTLIKQVYVDAFGNIAWSFGLVVVVFLLVKVGRKGIAEGTDYNMSGELGWTAYILAAIIGGVSFGLLVSAIQYFINPEFYAIRYILSQIGGG